MAQSETQRNLFDLGSRLALTIPEAAAALGVSERHLRRVLPELPHVHLGQRVVLPIDALRRWLEQRAQEERYRVDEVAEEIMVSLTGRSPVQRQSDASPSRRRA